MCASNTTTHALPTRMKAALATGFGDIDENIHVCDNVLVPSLDDNDNKDDSVLLLRVLCCALAPGDVRVLSGLTDKIQLPPSGHPYIVGSDVSGIVVQVSSSSSSFSVGDYVVGRFDEPQPCGGVAEYRAVAARLCAICPASIPPHVAAGLPASAAAAKRVVETISRAPSSDTKPQRRLLVIGGSGAVGSSVLQYAAHGGGWAAIVAVSTQEELCLRLGATQVLDYREGHPRWWEKSEFHHDKTTGIDGRFDVVVDLVNGDNWVTGARSRRAVQPSGQYVSLLTGVDTDMEAHNTWDMIKIMVSIVGRLLLARLHPGLPRWVLPPALALRPGDLRAVLDDVAQGRLEPLVDPSSPFQFTDHGVRQAMALQKSKHAHGKVIIKIAD